MHNEKYTEYLKSEDWDNIRKKVIHRAKGKCEGCADSGIMLDVHHLTYDRVGMELMTDLVALCAICHNTIHGKTEKSEWNKYIIGAITEKPICYEDMSEDEQLKYRRKLVMDGAF